MKVSLKWLSEYVEIPADLKAFCDHLDLTGTGVEGVEIAGAPMIRWSWADRRKESASRFGSYVGLPGERGREQPRKRWQARTAPDRMRRAELQRRRQDPRGAGGR